MTDLTGNRRVIVGEIPFAVGNGCAPRLTVALQGLGIGGLRIVMWGLRIDCVQSLRDLPAQIRAEHGILVKLLPLPVKPWRPGSGGLAQIDLAAVA